MDVESDAKVADALGMTRSALHSHKARGSVPYEALSIYCGRTGLSLDWLLYGRGEAGGVIDEGEAPRVYLTTAGLKTRDEIMDTLDIKPNQFNDWLNNNEFAVVPQVRGEAAAGGGLAPDNTVEMSVAFRADWLRRKGDHGNMAIIRVQGDSMEPTLLSGDIVLVDFNRNSIDHHGGVYVIAVDGDVMVKRVEKDLTQRVLRIISDNSRYDPQAVEPDRVRVNGKVIWYGREIER